MPSGLRIAAVPNVVITGAANTPTIGATAGGTSLNVSGLDVAVGGTVKISVDVTNVPGQVNASCSTNPTAFTNSAGNVTVSGATGNGIGAGACLVVTPAAPKLSIIKNSVGAIGSFAFTLIGVSNSTDTATTTVAGTDAPGVNGHTGVVGTAASITENAASAAGYTTSVACVDVNSAVSGNTGSVVSSSTTVAIPAAKMVAGAVYRCTFTNTLAGATLQLAKAWSVGSPASDTATIGATTGGAANTSSFGTAGGTAANSGAPVNVNAGNTITLPAETFSPAGRAANYSTSLACTASGGATANALSGTNGQASNTLVIGPGDAGKAIVCTYTNTALPMLTLAKTSSGTAGSIGAFVFSLSGVAGGTETITTVSAGSPVSGTPHLGTIGTAASVTETPVLGYTTATSCIDTNGAANGNGTGAVTTANGTATLSAAQMRAGAAWICSYTNTRVVTNLTISKIANPTNVATGGTVTFTLTVKNLGPAAADGAILRDKPGGGISCTAAPSCSANGGAVCPSPAVLTATAIKGNAGVAIPVLPAGSQAVVTLTCTATATGQ